MPRVLPPDESRAHARQTDMRDRLGRQRGALPKPTVLEGASWRTAEAAVPYGVRPAGVSRPRSTAARATSAGTPPEAAGSRASTRAPRDGDPPHRARAARTPPPRRRP